MFVKLCSASLQKGGGHVSAEWFCDADDMQRKNPHADACVRGSAIFQNNKCARALAAEFQPELDLLLREVNDKNVRIVFPKPVVSFVVDKGWTSTPFGRTFVGPTISVLNGMLIGSIYILMLHRLELSVHDVLLSIAHSKNVAFHIFRARFLSVDLKEHTSFGVHRTDAASVHCGVRHGAKVDE